MADKVHPSTKPAAPIQSFPATKAQLYNTNRPVYRPQPRSRKGRSCCATCCLWTTLVVVVILFLAAITGGIILVLYRPHHPSFSVSSFQISQFNLSSSSQLTTQFNLTVNARNPNKKLVFFYDPISVSIIADGVDVGDGSLPAFVHGKKNTTTLTATVSATGESVSSSSITALKSDLKSLPLSLRLNTKVRVKMGGVKTGKLLVSVRCNGIQAAVPTAKTAPSLLAPVSAPITSILATATTSKAKCKVKVHLFRIKIWKLKLTI